MNEIRPETQINPDLQYFPPPHLVCEELADNEESSVVEYHVCKVANKVGHCVAMLEVEEREHYFAGPSDSEQESYNL